MFHPASGRCIDVAVDHGLCGDPRFRTGIEDMASTVAALVEARPDAIQLTLGQAPLLQRVPGRDKPALVLRVDVTNVYGDADRIVALARQATELGADLIKADPTGGPRRLPSRRDGGRVLVLVRGGGRVADEEILERTRAVLDQGARGSSTDATSSSIPTRPAWSARSAQLSTATWARDARRRSSWVSWTAARWAAPSIRRTCSLSSSASSLSARIPRPASPSRTPALAARRHRKR